MQNETLRNLGRIHLFFIHSKPKFDLLFLASFKERAMGDGSLFYFIYIWRIIINLSPGTRTPWCHLFFSSVDNNVPMKLGILNWPLYFIYLFFLVNMQRPLLRLLNSLAKSLTLLQSQIFALLVAPLDLRRKSWYHWSFISNKGVLVFFFQKSYFFFFFDKFLKQVFFFSIETEFWWWWGFGHFCMWYCQQTQA